MSEAQKDGAEIVEIIEARDALSACIELVAGLLGSGLPRYTNDAIIATSNLAIAKSILALAMVLNHSSNDSTEAINSAGTMIADAINELKKLISLK